MTFISLTVKCLVKAFNAAGMVLSESNLFSSSNVTSPRELGLKTLERCTANISAFSSLLLAQLPSCFLIGGYYVSVS